MIVQDHPELSFEFVQDSILLLATSLNQAKQIAYAWDMVTRD